MKKFSTLAATVAALLCVGGVHAAATNPTSMSFDVEDTVAPAQQMAYVAGIKRLNQCLSQHGFKYPVMALEHVTGNTYVYSYVVEVPDWAAIDTVHATVGACDSVGMSDINPHLLSETSSVTTVAPGFSHYPRNMPPTTPLTDVVSFTLKPGMAAYKAFTDSVKEIYAAEIKANWPHYSELDAMNYAGSGAPDFQLIMPAQSWAEIGKPPSPSWTEVLAKVYGKQKADEIRKSLDDAIANTEEHVDRYDPALSYTPSRH
ncbi:MAG: hypothetical protein ACREPS_00855, partial [Rhodanobacteraceae bacterium]